MENERILLQNFDMGMHSEGADLTALVQGAIDQSAGEAPHPTHHDYGLYQTKCVAVLHLLNFHHPGYDIVKKYGWLCGGDKGEDEDEVITSAPTAKATTSNPSLSTSVTPTKVPTDQPTSESPTSAPTKKPSSGPSLTPTKVPTDQPTKEPSLAPTPTSTSSPTNCTDTPDWMDLGRRDCATYEVIDDHGCPKWGYFFSDMGPAVDNCCFCKSSGADGCFPRTCTDVSDCCDSGQDDDACVLKTGYCWDDSVELGEELVNCSTANECTHPANCTGSSPSCLIGGPVPGLGIHSFLCSNSTRPINGGVCGRAP